MNIVVFPCGFKYKMQDEKERLPEKKKKNE